VPLETSEIFNHLFEISRHLAHGVEITQIAAEVVERMKNACEYVHLAHGTPILATRVQRLNFLHSLLRGLSARSVSNEKRLASEQLLVSLLQSVLSNNDKVVTDVNRDISFPARCPRQTALSAYK
jgi:hypothetical protein